MTSAAKFFRIDSVEKKLFECFSQAVKNTVIHHIHADGITASVADDNTMNIQVGAMENDPDALPVAEPGETLCFTSKIQISEV